MAPKVKIQESADHGADGPQMQDDAELICMCMNLTGTDLQKEMEEGVDFEGLLEITGAGRKCTACLLDIEYFFETASRRTTDKPKSTVNTDEKVPWRRRLYAWIDRHAPLAPMRVADIAPVLYGPGIRQEFCVSNDTMHFGGDFKMHPVSAHLVLRDEDGAIVSKKTLRIGNGDIAWEQCNELEELGRSLPEATFKVGSLSIHRVWDGPSRRGATRPHFLIHTPGGISNLHTQDSGGSGDQSFSLPYRGVEERIFLTIVNDTPKAIALDLSYPYGAGATPTVTQKIEIPAHGARAHEINQATLSDTGFRSDTLIAGLSSGPERKVHMIFARPDLSILSIDHLSG